MSDYDYGLKLAESWGSQLRDNKVPYKDIVKVAEVAMKAQDLYSAQNFIDYGSAANMYSAYQIFYQKKGYCDSIAHMLQTVFDRNGYKTRLGQTSTHSWIEVKIHGKWYAYENAFEEVLSK